MRNPDAYIKLDRIDPMDKHLELQRLQREIADDTARTDIECKARYLHMIGYPGNPPLYDVSQLEPTPISDPEITEANRHDVQRAVQYLELRGLLVRPLPSAPQIVGIRGSTT